MVGLLLDIHMTVRKDASRAIRALRYEPTSVVRLGQTPVA